MICREQSERLRWNVWVCCTANTEREKNRRSLNYMHEFLMHSPASLALHRVFHVLRTPAHVLPLYSLCIFNHTWMCIYSLMEHSLVSTPLEFRAAHWLILLFSAAGSQSERQCHLVDDVSGDGCCPDSDLHFSTFLLSVCVSP